MSKIASQCLKALGEVLQVGLNESDINVHGFILLPGLNPEL